MRAHGLIRRTGAAVAALAMLSAGVVAVVSTAPAAGQQGSVRDITEYACPPDLIEATFGDIAGSTHRAAIECLAEYGITQGTTATTYSPARTVSRGQMATFVFRLFSGKFEAQRVVADLDFAHGFTDIAGHAHEEGIIGLASVGVVRGTTSTTYSPDAPVTRGQVAALLVRLKDTVGAPFGDGPDAFTDDDGHAHEADINRLAAAGVVQGVGNRRFDPNGHVTRAAMASFLARFLDAGIDAAEFISVFEVDLFAAMNAAQETQAGDTGATGGARVYTIGQPDVICYEQIVDNLGSAATAAHIHRGARNVAGDIVVPLTPPAATPDVVFADAYSHDCIHATPTLVADIEANPGNFYVNVHTQPFPQGAIRGQLGALSRIFVAALSGADEVPGPGDTDGSGSASIITTTQPDHVCYSIGVDGIDPPSAAHIHAGARGVAGPIEVTLSAPAEGTVLGCAVADQADVAALVGDPTAFYVNVHNQAFPQGAVRGQLIELTTAEAELTGGAEVPGPGHPDGAGAASLVVLGDTTICYLLGVEGIGAPTAAHIHEGGPAAAGPIVVPLQAPPEDGVASDCVDDADPAVVKRLAGDAARFYVNVHTAEFPQGAVRGQLTEVPVT